MDFQLMGITIHCAGVVIAVCTFLAIGLCHPLVIKTEYYWGTKFWWGFLLGGIVCLVGAFLIENIILSSVLGVMGASLFWGIGELFQQKKRVERGWFPMNPKRQHEYRQNNKNNSHRTE